MSNFGLSCDVCNRENVGVTWVNGMKFCAKCYQETFGETEKDRKITDLQSQLTEKDKEIDKLTSKLQQANEIINNPDTLIFQQQELIDNLQSQLAEKDVEIKKLNACVNFYKSYYISFNEKVIDELEKVKDIILNERKITSFKFDIFNKGKDTALFWLNEQIDNQIKQLKEGK